MPIDKKELELSLSLFKTEDGLTQLSGEMDIVNASIVLESSQTRSSDMLYFARFFRYLSQDFWNIYTILHRLKWEKTLWETGEIPDTFWMTYAQTDINQFHVEFRSSMDYLAKIIRGLPPKPWQSPGSYYDLLEWITNKENQTKLDTDVLQIIKNTQWFKDLRELRDLSVHKGGFSLVFGTKGNITFQTYDGWQEQVRIPEIMYNENIVDFELYSGLYVGYLLALFEKLCIRISKLYEFKYRPLGAYTTHFGLEYVKRLIELAYKL
jgi:hypothetical protein